MFEIKEMFPFKSCSNCGYLEVSCEQIPREDEHYMDENQIVTISCANADICENAFRIWKEEN